MRIRNNKKKEIKELYDKLCFELESAEFEEMQALVKEKNTRTETDKSALHDQESFELAH